MNAAIAVAVVVLLGIMIWAVILIFTEQDRLAKKRTIRPWLDWEGPPSSSGLVVCLRGVDTWHICGDGKTDVEALACLAECIQMDVSRNDLSSADAIAFYNRCQELGAVDTDIVKHALEDQERLKEVGIQLMEAQHVNAALEGSLAALKATGVTPEEDGAALFGIDDTISVPRRVAAFLRTYARRIRQNERWDVPETMAKTYESAAAALDAYEK